MSNTYNLQLQANNADLQTVLQTLQNKASGGGNSGDEINTETCTVHINVPSTSNYYICRENVGSDGSVSYNMQRTYTGTDITVKARCDSVMYILASTIRGVELSAGELLKLTSGTGATYKVPSTPDITAEVTFTN